MTTFLTPANKTTVVILLLTALLSIGITTSLGTPVPVAAQQETVLMATDWLQVMMGTLNVIASGAAVVSLTVAAPPVGLAVAVSFVGAYAVGVGGALAMWDGFGRPRF